MLRSCLSPELFHVLGKPQAWLHRGHSPCQCIPCGPVWLSSAGLLSPGPENTQICLSFLQNREPHFGCFLGWRTFLLCVSIWNSFIFTRFNFYIILFGSYFILNRVNPSVAEISLSSWTALQRTLWWAQKQPHVFQAFSTCDRKVNQTPDGWRYCKLWFSSIWGTALLRWNQG